MTGVRWTPEQLAAHQQRVGIPPIVLPVNTDAQGRVVQYSFAPEHAQ